MPKDLELFHPVWFVAFKRGAPWGKKGQPRKWKGKFQKWGKGRIKGRKGDPQPNCPNLRKPPFCNPPLVKRKGPKIYPELFKEGKD